MEVQPSQPAMGRSSNDSPTYSSIQRNSALLKTNSTGSSQSISSVLNNPHHGIRSPADWLPGIWSSSSGISAPEFTPLTKPSSSNEPSISRSDFNAYVSSISEPYQRFEDIRNHSNKEELVGEVEALVACLREVPALYFKEGFALEDGATFKAACPFSTITENLVLQEKLSQYLDVVEFHLVREISRRSDSFFEAQGQLQDLDYEIVSGCSRIRELKETVGLLDHDIVESARVISNLNSNRESLVALQQKLHLILNVNQALSALKLLVASGDCAGALDIMDDLQQLLEGDELAGLHCFRHLRDHLSSSLDSVNSLLSAEFMRNCIQVSGLKDSEVLSNRKVSVANGYDGDVNMGEDASNFRDLLLPIVVGLLRTGKLPSVLRIYRDTLTADMKIAIKTTVSELLPVLVSRSLESELVTGDRSTEGDGVNSSLASKLRSMPSDNFVHLLSTIYTIVQAHLLRAAGVKRAIEWIMSNLDGHYAADSVAAAIVVGASAAEMSENSEDRTTLLPFSQNSIHKGPQTRAKHNDPSSFSNMSRNFRADVLRENAEAVFAACDTAHGRWAKLLGVRALLHPKLRLQEFLSIYSITQEFITATEKIGGRLGYSIRGTLQSQAKAFVEFQHEIRMTKIKAVLDQETWVEVDVPDEFQMIARSFFSAESSNPEDPKELTASQINASSESDPSKTTKDGKKTTKDNNTTKDRGKAGSQLLYCGDVGYHMVNCGVILLKMLSEYLDMKKSLPPLSAEIVHRVVEILKFFNTRTCQLVLGAGAMQVSGLKSITSKHLALASQVISFTSAIIPEIKRVLLTKVPEARQALLLSEINRVAQDYKVHRDEIHSKLVQIMRERVLVHLRGLPQIVESWNRSDNSDTEPSIFARSVTKEVGFLQRVLSRTLHEADVQAIFRLVVSIFHSQISEAFLRLEINTPQAKERFTRDVEHLLTCIRSLPTQQQPQATEIPNYGQLDELVAHKFGTS